MSELKRYFTHQEGEEETVCDRNDEGWWPSIQMIAKRLNEQDVELSRLREELIEKQKYILSLERNGSELEKQLSRLRNAAKEMLGVISSTDYDPSYDDRPNNDDLNRWGESLSGHVDELDTEDIVLPSPPVVRTVSARFVNAGKMEPRVVEEEGHVDETVCIMTDVIEVEIFVGVCPVCKFQDVPIDSRYCPGCGRRIQIKEG